MESYKPEHIDCTHDLRCKWNHLLLKNKTLLEPPISLELKSKPVPMACKPCRPLHPSPRLLGHAIPSLLSRSPFHPHNALPARSHVRGAALARKIYLRVFTKLCLFLIVQKTAGLLSRQLHLPNLTQKQPPTSSQSSHHISA